jgi:hypothetical protein
MPKVAFQIAELPPRFHMQALTTEEQHAAWLVQSNLSAFESHVRAFGAALSLFDFCLSSFRSGPADAGDWSFVAARDAAMSIYHAYTVLDGVRQTLAGCPRLNDMTDKRALRSAGQIFHTYFRSFEDMRDAVSHIGEKMKTPKKFAEHAFSGSIDSRAIKADNVKRMTMSNVLDGRRFTNTWEGQVLTCEISQLSLSRLTEAKQHLWAAARPIETGTSLLAARTRLVTVLRKRAALSKPDEHPP